MPLGLRVKRANRGMSAGRYSARRDSHEAMAADKRDSPTHSIKKTVDETQNFAITTSRNKLSIHESIFFWKEVENV